MKNYNPIIGMEVHVQLKTKSGMFCGCKNDPDEKIPNINTCPVCLGLPGGLPVANKKAIEWTILLGLALGCKINRFSKFDRKHYFYPDLAKGYQISQYDIPFCYEGKIETSYGPIRITRVHLEEDTGKLIHGTVDGKKVSLVDFNRSGTPLVEIVTEPDIFSSAQAKEYTKKLRQIIRYLDIGNCDMEKGGMRLEANISLQKEGEKTLPNYKVELKNINSFRFLEKGIEYEIKRQKDILDKGETPTQETRGYNAEKNITYSQRSKESAADYRYFPDPDLPPIRINDEWMNNIKENLPESIDLIFKKWEKDYQIKKEFSELIFETNKERLWFDELFKLIKSEGLVASALVNLIIHKKLSINLFKDDYKVIIEKFKKLTTIDEIDDKMLIEIIKKVLIANNKAVLDYKSGKTQVINFLAGQVMKEIKKKVDFSIIVKDINKCIQNI